MANEDETRRPEEESPIESPEQLVPDPFVEMLVPDPSQPPPPTVTLAGLLGRSAKEGSWRLYFSSVLEHYAEFKEEDVLYSVKIPREQSPFAGLEATRVWIRHEAEVEYTRTQSRKMQAKVLKGGLSREMVEDGMLEVLGLPTRYRATVDDVLVLPTRHRMVEDGGIFGY